MEFLNSENLGKEFIKRYLSTHAVYLESIHDILIQSYFKLEMDSDGKIKENSYFYSFIDYFKNNHPNDKLKGDQNFCEGIIDILVKQGKFRENEIDPEYETPYFRNFRNMWYHECALNYNESEDVMKFPPWKITQFYYSIFSGVASLVRCDINNQLGHEKTINYFVSNFLSHGERCKFFLPPYNFYFQQGKIPKKVGVSTEKLIHPQQLKFGMPKVIEALKYKTVNTKKVNSIYHYFKKLREWVNYEDAYLFFRMYGTNIRKDLQRFLKRICFANCVQTEYFFIKMFGFDAVKLQYDIFSEEMTSNIGVNSKELDARFEVYREMFG